MGENADCVTPLPAHACTGLRMPCFYHRPCVIQGVIWYHTVMSTCFAFGMPHYMLIMVTSLTSIGRCCFSYLLGMQGHLDCSSYGS